MTINMKKTTNDLRTGLLLARAWLMALLLCSAAPLLAQNVRGGSVGDPTSLLDLQSTSKGLLLPRMSSAERSAIANPAEGLLIYNTNLGCIEINIGDSAAVGFTGAFAPANWTVSPIFDGASVSFTNATITLVTAASGPSDGSDSNINELDAFASIAMPTGGNLSFNYAWTNVDLNFDWFIIGVNGVVAAEGTLNTNGTFNRNMTAGEVLIIGIDDDGVAPVGQQLRVFNWVFIPTETSEGITNGTSLRWSCILSVNGRIEMFDCGSAVLSDSLIVGKLNGTTVAVPYSGGNGSFYTGQVVSSTGVTGLTASLPSGGLANGSGSLIYTITGIPSAKGIASFSLNIGGQSCTLNLPVTGCGAFIASDVWKEFMCHNLGANSSADPFVPSWELIGNYYQWGRKPTCFGRDGIDAPNPCSSPVYGAASPWGGMIANDNAGAITGWSASSASNGAWLDAVKTANDPCPPGFRVPTQAQWDGVLNANLNTRTTAGVWSNSSTNYSSSMRFGNSLLLPAAGRRDVGSLNSRGESGNYWSSTENTTNGFVWFMGFNSGSSSAYYNSFRTSGFSVRCIAE
jgi:uncharacterized protein (TIGR02145 family)